MARSAWRPALWIALALALAAPARAIDLVGQTSARFRWTAATGPVASYAVYVARGGAAFPTTPSQTVTATEATVSGAYGDSIQIQVAARDDVGNQGPLSEVSDVVRFVAPSTGSPALALSLTRLGASAVQGQTPPAGSFTIRNSGSGTLSWSVTESVAWLSASPASGSATTETDTVTVSYDTTGLGEGTYTGSISVGAAGLPSQTISVTLTISAAPRALVVSPTSLSATTVQGLSPPAQSFTVRNGGGGTLSWSVSENASWLSVAPTSGSATSETDTVTVSFAASGLAAGTYSATLAVAGTLVPSQSIAVTLTVSAAPRLQLAATALAVTATQGTGPASASFTVRNTGAGTLTWSIADDAPWLGVSPASGTTTTETDSITLTVDPASLAAGTHTANVVVSAPGAANAPQTVVVTLELQSALGTPGRPELVASP
jgi:hypothetical protein